MKAAPSRPAVGYLRVSTERQSAEGVSLDAQRQRIIAWARANGHDVAAIHQDAGLSGGRADNRPGLQAALDAACGLKCPLVVFSLSRLARSTKDCIHIIERLEKSGADLVSLSERIDTSSAAGRLFFRMVAVFGEFEADCISDRTRAALQFKRSQGERTGGIPYGFALHADGATLVPIEHEQHTLKLIRRYRSQGRTLQFICDQLARRGIKTKKDARWHPQTISDVLNRKPIGNRASSEISVPKNRRSVHV